MQIRQQSGFEPIPQEWNPKRCTSPGHQPPMHICIPQGEQYRHVCPECGNERILRPPQISF